MQLCAQPGDECRLAPAWLKPAALGDRRAPREDVRVRALQGEEACLQSNAQQIAASAEVVVGCAGEQMDEVRVAMQQRKDRLLEGAPIQSEGKLDSLHQHLMV